MKRSLSITLGILVKLGACLAACIGCLSKSPPDPKQPRKIHWRGADSNYKNTTTVQPVDKINSADNQ
jgi:hypothetical protein